MARHRAPAPAPALLVALDPSQPTPLYRQLYAALRRSILEGGLGPGTRLPSTRVMASELGISRNTVVLAFDQLMAEGYLAGTPRSGTRVAAAFPLPGSRRPAGTTQPSAGLSSRGRSLAGLRARTSARGGTEPRPFRAGVPALDEFPRELWARLTARRWRRPPMLGYGEIAGYRPLREAIAEYVRAGRGARCDPDQIIVVSGSQQGIDLAARLLLDPGDVVWMEEPGYAGARIALSAAGATLVPVTVDAEGLVVERGRMVAPRARMVYVSPSHQYPLGVTMSAPRRLDLLRWATEAGSWVLEDDYDSEFRYDARPLGCLQGMDEGGRVVYIGTFSKTMVPALRLGYLIVPEPLVDAFVAARAAADRHSPTLEQAVLADFVAEGHFARHVRRMRRLYAERQRALVAAVREELGDRVEVAPSPAGMHLVAWLRPGEDDQRVSASALQAGVEASPLSWYAETRLERGGLVLGWAAYPPDQIRRAVAQLAAVLR